MQGGTDGQVVAIADKSRPTAYIGPPEPRSHLPVAVDNNGVGKMVGILPAHREDHLRWRHGCHPGRTAGGATAMMRGEKHGRGKCGATLHAYQVRFGTAFQISRPEEAVLPVRQPYDQGVVVGLPPTPGPMLGIVPRRMEEF